MDKTKSSKGISKNRVLNYPHYHSMNKDGHLFKVEENDFPSLSQVQEKNPKSENNTSAYGTSLLTYSSKLKTLPVESSSQIGKFENKQLGSRLSKIETASNSNSKHMIEPSLTVQSNHQNFLKQSSMPISNKSLTDSKLNSKFSEVKGKKSGSFIEHTDTKKYACQRAMNSNRYVETADEESSSFEKNEHSSKKCHNRKNASPNVQKSPIKKGLSSPMNSDMGYSSVLESANFYHKENSRPNILTQQKKHVEANITLNSGGRSCQNAKLLNVNAASVNTSRNFSNKTRTGNYSGQVPYNSIKLDNNKNGSQSLTGTSTAKKKNKRKSKLKRHAALQTGKILFLTPEVHSKIVCQSNNISMQKNQNVLTNINDNEEYPELGSTEPKTIKESLNAGTIMHTKDESSTNLNVIGSEIDSKKNVLLSKDLPPNNNLEVTLNSDQKNVGAAEKPEVEKPSVHSNKPITLSLFDMLVTAKPRKKEMEKKDESLKENSSAKSFKKNAIQAVNPLASSKPTIKRGKEREKPKVKRPSRMRRLILMERQLKKENMAMKMNEAKDERQESEEIFSRNHLCHDGNEYSAPDNLETPEEIPQNYLSNSGNSDEAYDIFGDLNNAVSEHYALECDNTDPECAEKSRPYFSEKSKIIKEIINKANHSLNIGDNENVISNLSSSFIVNENDYGSETTFSLTGREDNSVEDLDSKTLENVTGIVDLSILNLSEKLIDLESKINDACCEDKNHLTSENCCQSNNSTNRIQELEHRGVENIISGMADVNVTSNYESDSEKKWGLAELSKLNESLDHSGKSVSIISRSFSNEERIKATKLLLHSRKFRKYCNHFISKEIDQTVFLLIDDLARFQDRMYQKDPVKAKIRRRLVYGLKEIKKHMKLKKIKCIIIATDIEDVKIEGGLNDSLGELISLAEAYQVPCVFSHWRYNLGKVCRKSVPVSCVGIFNYEGSEKNFKKMMELHDDSKYDYLAVTKKLASELTNDQVEQLFEAEKESVLLLREVSQSILRETVYFTPEGYRNIETSEPLKKTMNAESEDCNLLIHDGKYPSSIEEPSDELKKLDKDGNSLQKETDISTIFLKYKVVKQC